MKVPKEILGWWIADLSYHKCVEVNKDTHFSGCGEYGDSTWNRIHKNKLSDTSYEMAWRGCFVKVYQHKKHAQDAIVHNINTNFKEYSKEMVENFLKFGDTKFQEILDRKHKERERKIEEEIRLHAYLCAEEDGFRKSPDEYWKQGIKRQNEEHSNRWFSKWFGFPLQIRGCPMCGRK